MADEHAGIAEGDPVWVEIFATDVARARSFYSVVFNWQFNDETKSPKDEVVSFHFAGSSLFGGSITRADESERKRGAKGVKVYLFSNDLKKTMGTIVANGGKKVSDAEPEGDHGFIMRFEDCEGNLMGIYGPKA